MAEHSVWRNTVRGNPINVLRGGKSFNQVQSDGYLSSAGIVDSREKSLAKISNLCKDTEKESTSVLMNLDPTEVTEILNEGEHDGGIGLEDQSNTNTPQNKDLMDEDVNEFVEHLQIPSPQGSEISYGNIMSVNTLVGFLDESIEILETSKLSPEKAMPVKEMNKLPRDDSDLNVSSTEHCDSGQSENTNDCRLCNKSLPSETILVAHLRWVHNQCLLCGKYCYTNERLTEHLNWVHRKDISYQCGKCEKSFKFKVTLKEHLKTHYEKQLYKCYHCDKTYKKISYFIQHILTMHGKLSPEKPMPVKEMNKLPYDDQDVYVPQKLPQDQVKSQCVASASVANDNVVMCTNESSKDSDYYYKVISQQIATEGLTVVKQDETNRDSCHGRETIVDEASMTTKASKNPGHCDLGYHGEIAKASHSNCGVDSEQNVTQTYEVPAVIGAQSTEMFKQIAETDGNPILAQEIVHTSPNDQRYRTAEGSQFNSSTEHCKPGFSANNQKSPLCNKSFPSQRILIAHLRRAHQCGHCGQIFECQSDLTIHLRAHHCTPYHCNQCDKKYFQKYHLTRHLKVHHGENSYDCNECGRKFIKKGNFSKHLDKHNTERSCQFNDSGKKNFTEINGNSKVAQEIIHTFPNDQRYRAAEGSQPSSSAELCEPGFNTSHQKCPLCNKSFKIRTALISHLRRVHKQCRCCSKIFQCHSDLTTHMRAQEDVIGVLSVANTMAEKIV